MMNNSEALKLFWMVVSPESNGKDKIMDFLENHISIVRIIFQEYLQTLVIIFYFPLSFIRANFELMISCMYTQIKLFPQYYALY